MSPHIYRLRSLWMGLALAAVLVPAALTTATIADASTRSAGVPSPPGDLYEPPHPLPLAPPGTLIWAKKVKGLTLNPPATIWQILYHSRSRTGHDIPVSGFAIVPTAPAPDPDPSDSPKPTPCSTASAQSQPSPVSETWVKSSSPATRKGVLPRC